MTPVLAAETRVILATKQDTSQGLNNRMPQIHTLGKHSFSVGLSCRFTSKWRLTPF